MKVIAQSILLWLWSTVLKKVPGRHLPDLLAPEAAASQCAEVLNKAVALVRSWSLEEADAIVSNVRTVIAAERADKVASPIGLCFIPIGDSAWQSPRSLAGRLIWSSRYIAADRAGKVDRRSRKRVLDEASEARNTFLAENTHPNWE